MSNSMYKLIKQVTFFLSFILCCKLLKEGEYLRTILYLFSYMLFYLFTVIYQKKRELFTISYIFVFFILYIVYTYMPTYLTPNEIIKLNITRKYGYWFDVKYYLYFIISSFSYIIMIMYMFFSKYKISDNMYKIEINDEENKRINYACIVLSVIYFITKKYEVMVVIFGTLLSKFLLKKDKKISNLFIVLVMMILGKSLLYSRFKVVGFIFPVISMFIVMNTKSDKKVKMSKIYLVAICGLLMINLYGILSEIYKLNVIYNASFSIKTIFSSFESILYFSERQLYRLFAIWIKLGGYIIHHVDKYGYFYGLTYIKPLANIFDFEYISLPAISAAYDGANYAQPGLLAEGYANFGIIGAILNIFSIFVLMEFFNKKYCQNKNFTSLLFASLPFSQILLDGGTLNSAIFIIIICLIIYLFVNINKYKLKI